MFWTELVSSSQAADTTDDDDETPISIRCSMANQYDRLGGWLQNSGIQIHDLGLAVKSIDFPEHADDEDLFFNHRHDSSS